MYTLVLGRAIETPSFSNISIILKFISSFICKYLAHCEVLVKQSTKISRLLVPNLSKLTKIPSSYYFSSSISIFLILVIQFCNCSLEVW